MSKPWAFHDLPAEAFPLTMTAVGESTGRIVWEETVAEPAVVEIPALRKAHGEPVTMYITDATGKCVETRSDGTAREVKMNRAEKQCYAGNIAFFGGRWKEPCQEVARHVIGSPNFPTLRLCNSHFEEAQAAGLVEEPMIGPDDFARRKEHNVETVFVAVFDGGPFDGRSLLEPLPAPDDFHPTSAGRYVKRPLQGDGPTVTYDWQPHVARADNPDPTA